MIKVLPEHIANKIAAGEVVHRPESVVKELLENSLDAGALNIIVVVDEGGKRLIQVVDDGSGMHEHDAPVAFQRHATSKISSAEDLEAIRTYGFRGEALPSIAAVARVTMKTRRAEDDVAAIVQIAGGSEPAISRQSAAAGTSIVVQNLFYNVPARRKFLKSNTTEFRHVCDVVHRAALSHPEISLKFVSDGEIILDLKPGTQQQRVADVFGERQAQGMVWLDEEGELLSVHGCVGKPSFARRTRGDQYLFLNKRYIFNRNITHAVITAYEHFLLKNSYPMFILFLDVDPHRVDVNVHPAKLEAKFEDEQAVYRFVHSVVRKSLPAAEFVPAVSVGETGRGSDIGLRFTGRQHLWPGSGQRNSERGDIRVVPTAEAYRSLFQGQSASEEPARAMPTPTGDKVEGDSSISADITGLSLAPIWQVHDKYILLQVENGLMVIDQHVAHERVLYERALERFESSGQTAQQLLFPRTLQFSATDSVTLQELSPYLEQLGFSLKPFGGNTFLLEGVPSDLKEGDEERVLEQIVHEYKELHLQSVPERRDAVAKTFSCKAAVKAGDKLTTTEMRSLVEQLFGTKMPYVCPHGRPIVMRISVDELDRRFGRK